MTRHVCIPSNYSNKIGIQILKIGVSIVEFEHRTLGLLNSRHIHWATQIDGRGNGVKWNMNHVLKSTMLLSKVHYKGERYCVQNDRHIR